MLLCISEDCRSLDVFLDTMLRPLIPNDLILRQLHYQATLRQGRGTSARARSNSLSPAFEAFRLFLTLFSIFICASGGCQMPLSVCLTTRSDFTNGPGTVRGEIALRGEERPVASFARVCVGEETAGAGEITG